MEKWGGGGGGGGGSTEFFTPAAPPKQLFIFGFGFLPQSKLSGVYFFDLKFSACVHFQQ